MIKGSKSWAAFAALVLTCGCILGGCADKPKDPLSYLPEADLYLGINFDHLRNSPIGPRLTNQSAGTSAAEKMIMENSQSSKAAIDLEGGANFAYYSIVTGKGADFSKEVLSLMEQNGQKKKVAGLDAVTSSTVVASAVNNATLLMTRNEAHLETMVKAAQAKTARARDTKAFQLLDERFSTNSMVLSAAVAPLLARAEASIPGAQAMDPALRQAIQEIDAVLLSVNASAEPRAEIFLSLPNQESADRWKGRIAMIIAGARMAQLSPPQLELLDRASLAEITATANGLTIAFKFTVAEMEQFVTAVEGLAANRPQMRR